jgi:hypothetical protein
VTWRCFTIRLSCFSVRIGSKVEMLAAAENIDFEKAIALRNEIKKLGPK